jgi:type IV secretory pathway VirB10-like protein
MSDAPELHLETAQDRAEATPPLTGGQGPLNARADEPKPVKMKAVSVATVAGIAASVICGAMFWGFVYTPMARAEARAKAKEENQRTPPGSVKPADVFGNNPLSYADITKPAEEAPIPDPVPEAAIAATPSAGPAHQSRVIVQRAPREPRPAPAPRQYYERPSPPPAAPQAPRGPSELERARKSGLFFDEKSTTAIAAAPNRQMADLGEGPPTIARRSDYADVYGDRAILAPISPYELKAGTVIPAALLTGVDSEREGRVMAVVTENVFDTVSGNYLLIPQGARLLGRYNGDQTYGERRAYLVWERIIFTDGRSLTLNKEPGVDSAGASGVTGRVDRRLGQLVMASLFSGVITTLGEAARRDGEDKSGSLLGDAGDAASIEAARVGGRLIDRELEVKPTIRIAQGSRVQVLLTRDLILEPQQ